jgi:hypothetical protein
VRSAANAARCAIQEPPRETDQEQAETEADERRQRERDQDAEDSDGLPPLEPAPVHRVEPGGDGSRAEQTADERVSRARRQPAPPGEQVPERRAEDGGADHGDRVRTLDGDHAGDRAGNGRADKERTEHVEGR